MPSYLELCHLSHQARILGEPSISYGTAILWSACLVGAVICVMVAK